jgi:hypothetical protein
MTRHVRPVLGHIDMCGQFKQLSTTGSYVHSRMALLTVRDLPRQGGLDASAGVFHSVDIPAPNS